MEKENHSLSLSFKPLLALRMDLREWEVFFFGTAKRNGGMSSRSASHADPSDQPNASEAAGAEAARRGLENWSLSAGNSVRAVGRARAAMVVNENKSAQRLHVPGASDSA